MSTTSTKMVKERLSVTVAKELVEFLDQLIEQKVLHNYSHGVELALHRLREKMESGEG